MLFLQAIQKIRTMNSKENMIHHIFSQEKRADKQILSEPMLKTAYEVLQEALEIFYHHLKVKKVLR